MAGDMNIGEFGASLLGMVGDFISQLGQLFIATAIGMIAFNAGLKSMNPILMLGAGVALVAAGAMVSSFAKKGIGGASSSAGGGGGSSAASGYSGKQNQSNAAAAMGGNVTFEIQGNKLIGVMNNQDRRNLNFK
jgi:vacuolar-type H+-ATPase subunit I/STV1